MLKKCLISLPNAFPKSGIKKWNTPTNKDKNSISFLFVRDVPTDKAREKVSIDKETAINIIDNIFILQLYYFEYLFMISFA